MAMSYYHKRLYQHYLQIALIDAFCFHDNQKDKNNDIYYKHPLAVAGYFLQERDIEAAVVAILHDLVEDTPVTMDYIYMNYPTPIASAVDAITRREDETYRQYIKRLCSNDIARRVKKEDIKDNLNPCRLFKDAPLDRYYRALGWIQGYELTGKFN